LSINTPVERSLQQPQTTNIKIMRTISYALAFIAFIFLFTPRASAQDSPTVEKKLMFDIYGFIMMDMGYQSKQNDPNWFDVLRTTKLPAYKDQYAPDGRFFASVRQTRFGVKSFIPTGMGELKTTFEFELFGTGVDAGQTTLRLRHAYGELGKWGAGQTWSPFMDIDVFPNSVEYWGPPGMAFFRNVQVRYMPIQGDTRLTIALERPGASADGGIYADRVELTNVKPHFDVPDLSAEFRLGRKWGYIEIAGIARRLQWEDLDATGPDLSGDKLGWGLNLSSNIKFGKDVLRLQAVWGEGIQNYMNDAPADVALKSASATSVEGVPIPMLGTVAFLDHVWNEKFSTSIGYSMISIDNTDGQTADAFKIGHYALTNLLYYPVPNVMAGIEFQWGQRENHSDGFTSDDFRVQFSFKYNFSQKFYR
jgi:hypothetical protein